MHGKHWLVVVFSMLALVACEWKQANSFRCPDGKDCHPDAREDQCGAMKCQAPTAVCDTSTTTCVQCVQDDDCPLTQHVCTAQNTCVECVTDENCSDSKLCLVGGRCAALADVTYVGGDNTSDNPACSIDAPCQNLVQGLKGTALRRYIKVTGVVINPDVATISDKKVVIYGRSGAQISRSTAGEVLIIKGMMSPDVAINDIDIMCNAGSGGKDCVEIIDKATVTMVRVDLHDHGQAGIAMSGTKLVLEDSQVHGNKLEGLNVTGGIVELKRSKIYSNQGTAGLLAMNASNVTIESSIIRNNTGSSGGISITGSPFTIWNSLIVQNGSTGSTGGLVLNSTMGSVDFCTISGNVSAISGNAGIGCTGTILVSNSILTDNNSTVPVALSCTVSYSLTGRTPPALTGIMNITGDPKFINSDDPSNPGYFRIGSGSEAINKANPAATLDVDIDGEARSDATKDLGADEFH